MVDPGIYTGSILEQTSGWARVKIDTPDGETKQETIIAKVYGGQIPSSFADVIVNSDRRGIINNPYPVPEGLQNRDVTRYKPGEIPQITLPPTGEPAVKVLFAIYDPGVNESEFFIGGDRPTPTSIGSVQGNFTGTFGQNAPTIVSTGTGLNDYVVVVNGSLFGGGGNYYYAIGGGFDNVFPQPPLNTPTNKWLALPDAQGYHLTVNKTLPGGNYNDYLWQFNHTQVGVGEILNEVIDQSEDASGTYGTYIATPSLVFEVLEAGNVDNIYPNYPIYRHGSPGDSLAFSYTGESYCDIYIDNSIAYSFTVAQMGSFFANINVGVPEPAYQNTWPLGTTNFYRVDQGTETGGFGEPPYANADAPVDVLNWDYSSGAFIEDLPIPVTVLSLQWSTFDPALPKAVWGLSYHP